MIERKVNNTLTFNHDRGIILQLVFQNFKLRGVNGDWEKKILY